jgi:16S rRNA (uracil1498-N3)-methyltransferase
MDRIVLDRKVEIGKEIQIKGPPLEAFYFQGGHLGSLITLTDSEGNDFRGKVTHLSKEGALILPYEVFLLPVESPLEVILLQALPEKERMELIIQKTTELGVSAIIPFKSKKSISLEEREVKQKKSHRWQKIAIKAVQQSRRAKVPWVRECRIFEEVLKDCKEDGLKIILWEKEGRNLKETLIRFSTLFPPSEKRSPLYPPFEKGGERGFKTNRLLRVYVMVGPEGGFTQEEVKQAREQGFIPVKLGQRILRTETAAITLVGILQYELGDLG